MTAGRGPSITIEDVNDVVLGYGERQASFVRGENRDRLNSFLFDVPRRSVVGWEVVYEHGPWLLRQLQRYSSPEEVGRMMRQPASRPGYIQLTMLPCGYLSARQLRLWESGIDPHDSVADDRLKDLTTICNFTVATSLAFRGPDQGVFPPSGGGPHRILSRDQLAELEATLEPADAERRRQARRLSAVAATFALLLHGEQRDGLTGHGPYRSATGTHLFFVEYTDLRNDFLPWAPGPDAVAVDAVSLMYEVPADVEVRHDAYGSLATEPRDFFDQIIRMQVFARHGGELRRLSTDEIVSIQTTLGEVRDRLYKEIIDWPDRMRVEYGGWIFANHLNTFIAPAGAPASLSESLAQRADATSRRMWEQLSALPEVPNLYRHLREPDVPLFTPVR